MTSVNDSSTMTYFTFYDGNVNESKIIFYEKDKIITVYDNFRDERDESWTIVNNGNDFINETSCVLQAYSSRTLDYIGFNLETNNKHLIATDEWFGFGSNRNETIIPGVFYIRGIPSTQYMSTNQIYQYRSDIESFNSKIVYDQYHYFSNDNWALIGKNLTQIPIKTYFIGVENITYDNGTSIVTPHHWAVEYVSFTEGEYAFDETLLEFVPGDWISNCNVTHYCNVYPNSERCLDARGPSLPTIPDQYSYWYEVAFKYELEGMYEADASKTYFAKEYYDYTNNREHVIWYYNGQSIHQYDNFNTNQRWIWLGDEYMYENDDDYDKLSPIKSCTLTQTTSNYTGLDNFISEDHGHLSKSRYVWRFNDTDRYRTHSQEYWLGYETVRGINTEKWYSIWNDTYTYTAADNTDKITYFNGKIYYWFTTNNWTMGYQKNDSNVPIQVLIKGDYMTYNNSGGELILWKSGPTEITKSSIGMTYGKPDDIFFQPPQHFKENCNMSDYCNAYPNDKVCETSPIPELPSKFHTIVEGTILNKNRTYIMHEWFNYDLNKAKREFYYHNHKITILEDFHNSLDQLWFITEDMSTGNVLRCSLNAYSHRHRPGFIDVNSNGHLKSSQEWLQFGSEFNETYLGNQFNIRGMDAHGWNRKIQDQTSTNNFTGATTHYNYNLKYYFTNNNTWDFTNSNYDSVPVRATITGTHKTYAINGTKTADYMFDHIYEYVGFQYGATSFDDNELSFEYSNDWYHTCNITNYCNIYPNNEICIKQSPTLPELPYQFSLKWEFNDKNKNTTTRGEAYYDYYGNQAHMILRNNENYNNAKHQLDILNDSVKIIWNGDGMGYFDVINGCDVSLVDKNYSGLDLYLAESKGHIAHPAMLFRFNDTRDNDNEFTETEEVWMGYDTVRGIKAEKWKTTMKFDGVYEGAKYVASSVTYHYFSTPNLTTPFGKFGNNKNSDVIILRIQSTFNYDTYISDNNGGWIFANNTKDSVDLEITEFVAGKPDDKWFEPPKQWRKSCNVTQYCTSFTTMYSSTPELCDNGPTKLPSWPVTFSTVIEATFEPSGYMVTEEEFVDFENNFEKIIIYPNTINNSPIKFAQENFNNTNTRVFLEWGKALVKYEQSMSGNIDNCVIERIRDDNTSLTNELFGWFTHKSSEHVILSSRVYTWINNKYIQQYMGIEYIRGVPCYRYDSYVEVEDDKLYVNPGDKMSVKVHIVYYWMEESYNVMYPKYNIPVRIRIYGHSSLKKYVNNVVTQTYYDHDFNHIYDFINFIPATPPKMTFTVPSLATCNLQKWCTDIKDIQYEYAAKYAFLTDLCDKSDVNNKPYTKKTSCYIDKCGNEYKVPQCENDICENAGSGLFFLAIIAMLFVGIGLGCLLSCRKREKKTVSFRSYGNNETYE